METSFDDFINQQIAKKEAERPLHPVEIQRQWEQDLEQFNSLVKAFLRKYTAQEKIRIEEVPRQVNEEIIGAYEVRSLVVEIGANKVYFDPVGRFILGARGRVDMHGPRGTVKFLLVPKDASESRVSVRVAIKGEAEPENEEVEPATEWTWKIGTPPPDMKYVELEEETFYTAVMEVVNG